MLDVPDVGAGMSRAPSGARMSATSGSSFVGVARRVRISGSRCCGALAQRLGARRSTRARVSAMCSQVQAIVG